VALVGRCSFRLAALAALLVVGCGEDDPRSDAVDEATAEVAIATEDGFSAAVIAVATDGATPEAARILATAAVRRAPFLAELADRGPEIVTDFVAALVDADPATTAPLVASVVEGLGLGLHAQLVSYSGFDFDTDAPGVIPPLPVILTIPAGDLNTLALAVATATNGAEAAPGALLNALDELAAAAETAPEDGSLLGTLNDQALLGLGADADGGGPNAVGDALGRGARRVHRRRRRRAARRRPRQPVRCNGRSDRPPPGGCRPPRRRHRPPHPHPRPSVTGRHARPPAHRRRTLTRDARAPRRRRRQHCHPR
jgi:hypothetical protein